jgi:ribonucleoside-diphosphate reductase alpha chain
VPAHLKDKYKEVFQIDPSWLLKSAAHRGKWVDQSQSLNIYFAGTSGRELASIYEYAWSLGLKTTYYLRSLGASQIEKSTVNASEFGSTHKRETGSSQTTTISNNAQEAAQSIPSPISVTPAMATVPTPTYEKVAEKVADLQPVIVEATPVQVVKKKYNITVMPEATCEACQ